MVMIRMPDGDTQDYHLRASRHGLRLVRACASYDLMAMIREGGWTIAGVRTRAAKRMLEKAGLLDGVAVLVAPSASPSTLSGVDNADRH